MKGPEIFAIPRGEDRYYLYAPLHRSLAVVNGAAVSAVATFLESGMEALNPVQRAILDQLQAQGMLEENPKAPAFPEDYGFCPHEVTLFPTTRCNLRCRYCYADAGKRFKEMPWEVAKGAIDHVSENAGLLGSRVFALGFHGGGEPTLAWGLVQKSVEYAETRAEALGLELECFAATNGLLTPGQRVFIAKHFSSVTVSLDGPPAIQNHNRPQADGAGSYEGIAETLDHFRREGLRYGLRATISATTVDRMEEIAAHFLERFAPPWIQFEPVWNCGRCASTGERPPEDGAFMEGFQRARKLCEAAGVDFSYSGARLSVLANTFCAAPGDGFAVLPEGIVTSCFEVTEPEDARASIFHYGRFEEGAFHFDGQRLKALRNLSLEHLEHCRDCFCRWHCAGDCLAKAFLESGSPVHKGSLRCELNRALTLEDLDRLVPLEGSCDA